MSLTVEENVPWVRKQTRGNVFLNCERKQRETWTLPSTEEVKWLLGHLSPETGRPCSVQGNTRTLQYIQLLWQCQDKLWDFSESSVPCTIWCYQTNDVCASCCWKQTLQLPDRSAWPLASRSWFLSAVVKTSAEWEVENLFYLGRCWDELGICIHLWLGVPIMHEDTNVISTNVMKPQQQKQENTILNDRGFA